MSWVAGVDGCRGGWFVVARDLSTGRTVQVLKRRFVEILSMHENPRIIAVDIPIGLPAEARRGGRQCDRDARVLLGASRRMSVFSPPARSVLGAATYAEAGRANRATSPDRVGLTRQVWAILPKIAEVDAVVTPEVQQRVRECMPELSFAEMVGRPIDASKRGVVGIQDRARAIVAAGFADPMRARGGWTSADVAPDDILDAHACCWSAARIFQGSAVRLPGDAVAERDRRGLAMEIWY